MGEGFWALGRWREVICGHVGNAKTYVHQVIIHRTNRKYSLNFIIFATIRFMVSLLVSLLVPFCFILVKFKYEKNDVCLYLYFLPLYQAWKNSCGRNCHIFACFMGYISISLIAIQLHTQGCRAARIIWIFI